MSRPTAPRRVAAAGLALGCALVGAPTASAAPHGPAAAPLAAAAPRPAPCPGTTIPSPTPSPTPARPAGTPTRPTGTTARPSPAPSTVPPPVVPHRDVVVGGEALASAGLVAPQGVPAPPLLEATSYVIADAGTGEIVAAKAPHAQMRPASTLKALTALVLLPRLKRTDVVTATPADMGADGTKVGVVTGNRYRIDQLFQAMLMSSANDAVYALARTAPGGRARTVADANALAKRLGAHDTVVKDPSGLDADGQLSSAYDLALVGRAALRSKDFREYSTTTAATFPGAHLPGGAVVKPYAIQNHNKLLYNYPGAIGAKNGYTSLAHGTFIAAASRGGRTYLLTYMCSDRITWHQMASAFDWAFRYGPSARPVGRLVEPGSTQATPAATPSTTAVSPAAAQVAAVSPSPSPSGTDAGRNRWGLPLPGNDTERWWGAGAAAVIVLGLGLAGAARMSRRR